MAGQEEDDNENFWSVERDFRAKSDSTRWTNQDWNAVRQPKKKKNWDEESLNSQMEVVLSTYLEKYIHTWQNKIPKVKANFLSTESEDMHEDCDVDTTTGLLMPPVKYPASKMPGPSDDARLQMTTAIRIEIMNNKHELRDPARKAAPQPADMEGVATIYNMEVQGIKVADRNPVGVDKFHNVLAGCRTQNMPFVVALGGYAEQDKTDYHPVIGFAVVDTATRGIQGAYQTHGDIAGKLIVIVHPEYRHARIGTALMDVIEYNPRKWWYLEVNVHIQSGINEETTRQSEEFQWISKWLEDRFMFLLHAYDRNALRDSRQEIHPWIDRLTFRHDCRYLGDD
ncbi:hypothetical protein GGR56DRAFT_671789 [Xylariaceae sp. FL0804]|nr:hypothetical protein GGR56DRAFT_671789 [Xylariaceae sp. FL0804]